MLVDIDAPEIEEEGTRFKTVVEEETLKLTPHFGTMSLRRTSIDCRTQTYCLKSQIDSNLQF